MSTLAAWATLCRDLANGSKAHVVAVDQQPSTSKATSQAEGGGKGDDQDITLEEAKLSVEQLLRILVNLGVAIRQASAASRLSNADRTFKKHKHKYSSLIEHLTFLLQLSDISREKVLLDDRGTTEERIQVSIALEGAVEQQHPLRFEQQALINANVKRLHRFEFAKKRRDKLKMPVDKQDSAPDSSPQEELSRPQSTPALTSEIQYPTRVPKASSTKGVEKLPPPSSQYSIATTNQLSEFVAEVPLETTVEEIRAPTAIALKADYPKPPKPSNDATGLVCPYCSLTLLSETAQTAKWKSVDNIPIHCIPYTKFAGNMFRRICSPIRVTFRTVHRTTASSIPSRRGKHMSSRSTKFPGDGHVSSANSLAILLKKAHSVSISRRFIEMLWLKSTWATSRQHARYTMSPLWTDAPFAPCMRAAG